MSIHDQLGSRIDAVAGTQGEAAFEKEDAGVRVDPQTAVKTGEDDG